MEKLELKCKLSNHIMLNYETTNVGIYYNILLDGAELEFRFCKRCFSNPKKQTEILANKELILSFLLNDKIYKSGDERMHWREDTEKENDGINLKEIIKTAIYPKSPKEKLDHLFKELFKLQNYDGEKIQIAIMQYITEKTALSLYFKNEKELVNYFRALEQQGDINVFYNPSPKDIYSFNFTYQGLNNYIKLFEEGYNSKNCFIAMSFDRDETTTNIRNTIKSAISETGYIPILVDEKHFSDKTIPDEIIHLIRNCKFSIADFTGNKHGVYFEAGFAVGQGKPVIYTCKEDQFSNVHFDIKQFQHIIYKTNEELKQSLVNKIKAWII